MPAEDLIPIEKPTGLHRYVERSISGTRDLHVHQMEWSVVDFTTGSNGTERLEWRDVPLVKGLPDYEKPPLGQPPAFLQEQEKTNYVDVNVRVATVRERLLERHRVDSERMWPAPSDLDLLAAEHIKELENWNRLRAEDIINLGQQVGRLTQVLEKIACPHVTENPLWWQLEARAALQPKEPK